MRILHCCLAAFYIDNYGYRQLSSLFKIPDNMTLEQFEEILKNNFVYKKFKRIITDNKKY